MTTPVSPITQDVLRDSAYLCTAITRADSYYELVTGSTMWFVSELSTGRYRPSKKKCAFSTLVNSWSLEILQGVMEQEGAATVRCYAWATLPAMAARLWCGTSCFSFRQPIAKRLKQPKPVWVVSGILPFFSSYQVKSRFFFFVVIPPLSVLLNADNGKSSLSITFKSKARGER